MRGLSPAHPGIEALGNVYERALVSMHKMPRVWLEYLEFLVEQVGTDPSWEGSGSRSGAAGEGGATPRGGREAGSDALTRPWAPR